MPDRIAYLADDFLLDLLGIYVGLYHQARRTGIAFPQACRAKLYRLAREATERGLAVTA